MKVLALMMLAIASVSARGSGPYLPSGWRPDGPAFDLPTKQFPTDNPLQDLILNGSEASGSDSLREYGPPEVLQGEIKQNLPKETIALTFTSAEESQKEVADSDAEPPKLQESQPSVTQNLLEESTEAEVVEKTEVTKSENIKAQEEPATESQAVEATTLQAEVPILIIKESSESVGFNNVVKNEVTAVTETLLPGEVNTLETNQNVYDSTYIQNVNQNTLTESSQSVNSLEDVKVELEQSVQEIVQNFEQSVVEVVEQVVENVEKAQEYEEKEYINVESAQNAEGNVKIEQNAQIVEDSDQNIVKNAEEVEEKSDKAQDVKEVVQSIPEIVTFVNNEIKRVEKTESQNDVSSNEEFSASLEQGPEGFLEYGPPGFREYGPPKEDELARDTADVFNKLISEAESFESTNEARRRRFSPKFRPTNVHH